MTPDPPSLADQALALQQEGDLVRAEDLFRAALTQDPNHFIALHQMGVLLNQRGDFEGGSLYLREALKVFPRSALAHFNLGISLWHLFRLEEALSHYQYSLAIKPDQPEVLLSCAVTLMGLDRPEDAETRLIKLLALDPQHPGALDNLATIREAIHRASSVKSLIKLNLGCGFNQVPGFVNVDLYPECSPDLVVDLEAFPWIWEDGSVDEVLFHHSLEHLGATPRVFLEMMKELYRVSVDGCRIQINVPHPRHDDFIGDPTHVRIITPQILRLFSLRLNEEWKAKGIPNSPLATYLHVNFELEGMVQVLAEPYATLFEEQKIQPHELNILINEKNNIVHELKMVLKVIK